MKKLLSTSYSAGAFSTAILLLRLGFGILMMHHGYLKLIDFEGSKGMMPEIFGMSKSVALSMDIFAEFFCSLFIIIGLFTRLATVPLIIAMFVALYQAHHFDFFASGEKATLFLIGFIVLLFVGPGRVSVDSMIAK